MPSVLTVSRLEDVAGAACLIEAGGDVPLRFRTHDRPLGSGYVRLGKKPHGLAELLLDPGTGLLRGVTITLFEAVSSWPDITMDEGAPGLPVLTPAWGQARRIDVPVDFHVAARGTEVLLSWEEPARCEAHPFHGRVEFLVAGGQLCGVRFAGLSPAEVASVAARAVHPS